MSSSATNAEDSTPLPVPAVRSSFGGARLAPPRAKPAPPRLRARRRLGGVLLILGLTAAAAFATQLSVRRALAARWTSWATSATVADAVRLDPGNPVAQRRAAFLAAQRSGDPGAAIPGLRQAVADAPLDSESQLELAATLQASGDDAGAEAVLLQTAALDSGYRPRWSLMNFYLRQGRVEEFWEAAQAALLANPDAAPMVLGLCWRAFGDSALILEKAVPDSPAVYRRYFSYLLDHERLAALIELWPRLAPGLEAQDVSLATLFLDRLILAGEVETAVSVWNRLCRERFLDYAPLNYPAGPFLTNGDFAARVSGVGFDWTIPPARGVFRVQRPADFGTKALEVRLSGAQTDDTLLLSQVAPLPPGQYLFRYEYATQQLPRLTGLFWVVRDIQTDRVLAQSPFVEAEEYWNTRSFVFDSTGAPRFLRLELRYRLPEGVENHRGLYVMRHSALSGVDPQGAAE